MQEQAIKEKVKERYNKIALAGNSAAVLLQNLAIAVQSSQLSKLQKILDMILTN